MHRPCLPAGAQPRHHGFDEAVTQVEPFRFLEARQHTKRDLGVLEKVAGGGSVSAEGDGMGPECLRPRETSALSAPIEKHELAIFDVGGLGLETLERTFGVKPLGNQRKAFGPECRVGYVLRRDHPGVCPSVSTTGRDRGA